MNKQKYTDAITALETSAQLHKDAVSYSKRAVEKAKEAVKLFKEAEENDKLTVSEEKTTVQVNGKYTLLDDNGLHIFSTPDSYRKHIVDLAKEDIDGLENRSVKINQGHKSGDIIDSGFDPLKGNWTRAKFNEVFHVNKEKRTVVCLLVGHKTGHVYSKGIAKCDPNDTFNEHLGKIIAYYRAANEEVPEIFLTVPNPEIPKVGDLVQWWIEKDVYEIKDIRDDFVCDLYHLGEKNLCEGIHYGTEEQFMERVKGIIDDSNRK